MPAPTPLRLLAGGDLAVEGRLVDASNTTLVATVTLGAAQARCVYKPVAGERPLWDFPDGTLAGREVAAYLVSESTGWGIVPPTVLRDGPYGPGMCQLWVEPDPGVDLVDIVATDDVLPGWLRVLEARDGAGRPVSLVHADDPRLRRMAVFDAVINNGDRKGGHVLPMSDGRVFGVDHGVSFSVENKLRTVLWGWAGSPLDGPAADVLDSLVDALAGPLGIALQPHLTAEEIAGISERAALLGTTGTFPLPGEGWPPLPWPPF